jgi:hypothetical protein
MISSELFTGSNDNEKGVVGGRNDYGAKPAIIFSNLFIVQSSNRQYILRVEVIITRCVKSVVIYYTFYTAGNDSFYA